MKVSDILEMAAFSKITTKSGMPQYGNENFLLWGARERKGYPVPPGHKRIEFVIMDVPLFYEYQKAGDPTPADTATVGMIEFFINKEDGEIDGIINIELDPKYRNKGRGRQIIQDVKDTTKNGFSVYAIMDEAKRFWEKVGLKYDSPVAQWSGRIEK